jgi:hypothetical protein
MAAGCDFGATLVGHAAMRYKVDGPGQPFSGDRLMVHPGGCITPCLTASNGSVLIAPQRHMTPQRAAAIRCIRKGVPDDRLCQHG